KPSTVMLGYARASEMAAQPTPQATSATLVPSSLVSRAWRSGIEGRYSVPREPTSHGRLKSPCASIMSRPYALQWTGPPERKAATSSGMTPDTATNALQNGTIEYGLSGSSSG